MPDFTFSRPKQLVGLAALALALLSGQRSTAQRLPAFPSAEGAGKYTTGGRGKGASLTTVFEVTSLADTNTPGTLRYALTQTAAYRTVVFRVCGTIHLTANLSIKGNTTVAGQTAPGDGICLADHQVSVSGDNVIVRFMRFRLGDQFQNKGMVDGSGGDDAFNSQEHKNIIIDHCTMSWSDDEAFTFYGATTDSLTLQWNLISEPLNYSYHFETGDADFEHHGYGGIWGGKRSSFHHNLLVDCNSRTPRFNGSRYVNIVGLENCDFRNNVLYNWGSNNVYGGEGGNYNIVNNYYKSGPSTSSSARYRIVNPYKQTSSPTLPYPKIYLTGNYVDGSLTNTNRNWLGVLMNGGTLADTVQSKVTTPFDITAMPTQSAADAYTSVLQNVGAVLPARDAVDQRIIADVRNRTGAIIDVQGGFPHGTPYSTSQVAWPVLNCGPAPIDSDHDGMPDAYEISNGLNPNDAADRAGLAANGYPNLENYLNGIVATVTAVAPTVAAAPALRLFPNPASTQLTLLHPVVAGARISVYSLDGRLLSTTTTSAGSGQSVVNVAALARGLYLVRYADAQTTLTTKFVKE